MGMRITTGMMMNTYRYNLQQSTGNLDGSREKVLTQRKFNSYAEDPASATHAWRVRRSLTQNAGYQVNNTETYTRLHAGWITMAAIDDKLLNGDGGAFEAIKRADNDPTGGARTALGKVLSNLADSLVFSMNGAKYGDHFIFAGNDEMNAPFTWEGDKLLYRGVSVDAGSVADPAKKPAWGALDEFGIPANIPGKPANDYEAAWKEYYTDLAAPVDAQKALDRAGAARDEAQTAYDDAEAALAAPRDALLAAEAALAADPTNADLQAARDEANAAYGDAIAARDTAYDTLKDARNAVTDAEAGLAEAQETAKNAVSPADKANQPAWYQDWVKNGGEIPAAGEDATSLEKAYIAYAHDQRDLEKLKALSAEEKNVDLGMGLKEAGERELIESTAFNRALPGINMLGFGIDEDGDPKNIVSIMKRLADLYSQATEEGKYPKYDENGNIMYDDEGNVIEDDAKREEVYRLLNKFGAAHDEFNKSYSEVDTKSEFLLSNGERLKDQGYNLKEQIADLEQVDLADAINDFSWAYYCYSSALKVGTQLLSQSLIDYMR